MPMMARAPASICRWICSPAWSALSRIMSSLEKSGLRGCDLSAVLTTLHMQAEIGHLADEVVRLLRLGVARDEEDDERALVIPLAPVFPRLRLRRCRPGADRQGAGMRRRLRRLPRRRHGCANPSWRRRTPHRARCAQGVKFCIQTNGSSLFSRSASRTGGPGMTTVTRIARGVAGRHSDRPHHERRPARRDKPRRALRDVPHARARGPQPTPQPGAAASGAGGGSS